MIKILFLIILSFTSFSCTQFIQQTDDHYYEEIDNKSKSPFLHITFSHNINGETHPCGCRNHPLGGLPQIAGAQHEVSQSGPMLYVDSGDAFFPSTKVPKFIAKSLTFTAYKIAEAMDQQGLKYFVPGDQDFSLGEEFLIEISNKHKFEFILSNASPHNKIKHKKWALTKFGNRKILFVGILYPDLLLRKYRSLFVDPISSLKKVFAEVDEQLGGGEVEKMTVILLSHSGIEYDKIIAKKFKQIDWIIGAHSQSFFRYTVDINNAKITQVLSRNHYLGHIKLPANNKSKHEYKIIEVRDRFQSKEVWKKNPFIPWLNQYKTDLEKVQIKEQEEIAGVSANEVMPTPTARSCFECHQTQGQFWQTTAHSLAFVTLDKAKAGNNPSCVGCHSLKFKSIDGFSNHKNMVKTSNTKTTKYWNEWSKIFKGKLSPRNLNGKQRKSYAKKWFKLDKKHGVTHNYANVQCLNCHNKAKDHPFDMESSEKANTNFQKTCIKCHTKDQSPEWYNKSNNGVATSLNKKYFSKQLKKVACPK